MKNLRCLSLLIICFAWAGQLTAQEFDLEKRKELLIGYWYIEDKGVLIIENNGSISIEANGEVLNQGNWKLNQEGTVFYILEEEEIKETMQIVEVSPEQFIFKPDNGKVVTLLRTTAEKFKMPDELEVDTDAVLELRVPLSAEEITQRKALLVGNWVVGEDNIIVIQSNGTIQEKTRGNIDKSGTWQLSEDGHTFYISEEDGDGEIMNIIDLTEDKLVGIVGKGTNVVLMREKPTEAIDLTTRKKLIVGTWEVNEIDVRAVENPNANLQLIIKKGGAITSFKKDEFNKTGKWTLSPQGDYLIITSKDEPEQKMRILSLDKEYLQLMSGSQVIDFIRVK